LYETNTTLKQKVEGLHHSLYHNVCGIILDMTRTAGLFT